VLIRKRDIISLSDDIRRVIDGQDIDLRDNREGVFSILKNDVHTLASLKNEQVDALKRDRDNLKNNLTNISHQLKTPLTSMTIMADLIENAPPDKQAEFISNIKICLARMDWLISALLKIAKLDVGAVELKKERVQSGELIRAALTPLLILLDVKNQQIDISNETEFLCDKRWTAEALTNIIKNASESSPFDGVIRIDTGANPICAWISVTDSGAGIRGADIPRLFKRFEGSQSDTGYGVGLPLALAIMRGQNGDIEADGGGNGAGATFTLKLYK